MKGESLLVFHWLARGLHSYPFLSCGMYLVTNLNHILYDTARSKVTEKNSINTLILVLLLGGGVNSF